MKIIIVLAAIAAIGSLAQKPQAKQDQQVGRAVVKARCAVAPFALRHYEHLDRRWLALQGIHRAEPSPRIASCARRIRAVRRYRQLTALHRAAYYRWRESFWLTDHHWWRKDVSEAQKAYPGTASWLLSCSSSEGGWGRWVPNSGGSGAGGWMQYMSGTFYSHFSRALTDLKQRGFHVPESSHSWYSSLGQALAAAWAYGHGGRDAWYGGGCY